MTEKIGISGSHGHIGSALGKAIGEFEALGREGQIPINIDIVIDCASYGNLSSHVDEAEILRANIIRVHESLQNLGDRKYIYLSSSSVNLSKQTLYSITKQGAEMLVKLAAEDGQRVCIVRPYTVTGVGDNPQHLIPKLIDSCLNGTEMPFVPWPKHDFVDIEDFVDALITIKDKGKFEGEIYEIGSGQEHTNQEVLELVEEITGKKANIKIVESIRSYDTDSWVSNNSAIYDLYWRPKKTLRQSVKEMIKTYD